ncbi:MAG TPA: sugar isomerase domain-containing protein [Armatimonadota bacterium]|jgi:uncharacterized phosphosugar-binding protein
MLAESYAQAAHAALDRLVASQLENLDRGADLIVHALTHGGALWLYGIGHGGELELFNRAGGLMAARLLTFSSQVSSPVAECLRDRPRPEPINVDIEQTRLAVKTSELRAGDVLLLASVSGRNVRPVELSLACRELGMTVIAMTSLEYTAQVDSAHPSGKKLCEVADVVLDNGAPFGDAGVTAEGYEYPVLPLSGLAQTALGWMLCAQVLEKMAALGTPAHVYISHNRPGGPEFNAAALKLFNETGY